MDKQEKNEIREQLNKRREIREQFEKAKEIRRNELRGMDIRELLAELVIHVEENGLDVNIDYR